MSDREVLEVHLKVYHGLNRAKKLKLLKVLMRKLFSKLQLAGNENVSFQSELK